MTVGGLPVNKYTCQQLVHLQIDRPPPLQRKYESLNRCPLNNKFKPTAGIHACCEFLNLSLNLTSRCCCAVYRDEMMDPNSSIGGASSYCRSNGARYRSSPSVCQPHQQLRPSCSSAYVRDPGPGDDGSIGPYPFGAGGPQPARVHHPASLRSSLSSIRGGGGGVGQCRHCSSRDAGGDVIEERTPTAGDDIDDDDDDDDETRRLRVRNVINTDSGFVTGVSMHYSFYFSLFSL